MKYRKTKVERHVFVCTNERPAGHPRGCCSEKGSGEIVKKLKEGVKARGMTAQVRAQRAGCLDTCEVGPSMVVYPDGVWYGGVSVDDIDEIIDSHLVEGKPVERIEILKD